MKKIIEVGDYVKIDSKTPGWVINRGKIGKVVEISEMIITTWTSFDSNGFEVKYF